EKFRDQRLFFTPYHPDVIILRALSIQCFKKIGAPRSDLIRIERCLTRSPFSNHQLPIHPSVARHFGLKFVSPNDKYIYLSDGNFTVQEFSAHYVRCQWSEALERGIALGNAGDFDA